MRKILASIGLLFALAFSPFSWAANVVQTAGLDNEAFASSFNVSISAVTSGNTVIVAIFMPAGTTISDVTDNGGATPSYTTDFEDATMRSSNNRVSIRRRSSITDAPTQITVTMSGNTYQPIIAVLEVSDYDSFGQSNIGTYAYTDAATAAVTTTTTDELGICFSVAASDRTWTNPTGYTRLPTPNGGDPNPYAIFYLDGLGAAGSETCDPVISSSTNMHTGMVTYEFSGGGGGTTIPITVQQLHRAYGPQRSQQLGGLLQ